MPWINQRRIFERPLVPGCSTHAQVPTPVVLKDRIRVYYSARRDGKSFIAFFDLADDLKSIIGIRNIPIMEAGRPGMFDADGTMPSCVVHHGVDLWMYYTGWSELKNTARYQNEIGLAVSSDGGDTFKRLFEGPVMGRTMLEHGICVMPFVIETGGCWQMYYQSLTHWVLVNGQYEPVYVIKYATSVDGVNWERSNRTCVPPHFPDEAFSRPCVFKKDNRYHMLYCSRDSEDYRDGYGSYYIEQASSEDGFEFERGDKAIEAIGEWESTMLCYPYVFEFNGKLLMLYNGNGFGQTGVGMAEWED